MILVTLFWTFVAAVLFALVYSAIAAVEGWLDFKGMPRESEMGWCPNGHGHFKKEHELEWSPGYRICPICYMEAMNKGEGKR